MDLMNQFKGIVGPQSIQYVYDRLTAVVGDFLAADKQLEAAYGDRGALLAQKSVIETEIKLDESEAFMNIQGEGKTAYAEINGQKIVLANEQARDAYRRHYTKDKRKELAMIESRLAVIDVDIARAKDKQRTAADSADSLKATAAVQAALLTLISKVTSPNSPA